jgi:MFS family permease
MDGVSADGVARVPPVRRVPQLLRDRAFGPYFLGQVLVTMAIWIYNVAAAIIVWELTRSTSLVAAITIGQFVPQILLTAWSGARADRADRRRQLVAGSLITALGSGLLVAWSVTVGLEGEPGAWAVILTAVIVGVGFAVGGPAGQALLPSLVRLPELPTAIAISSAPFTVARAVGPALGALLVTIGGATLTFSITTVLHASYALMMYRRERTVNGTSRQDARILIAITYLGENRPMAYLLLGVMVVGLGVDPIITLAPAFADGLGGGGDIVGAIASAFGVGALLGFAVQPGVRRRLGIERAATLGLLILALGLAPLALVTSVLAAVVTMVLAGVGMTLALTAFTTTIQQRVPDALRGRVMALWSLAFLGSRPLGAAISGFLSDVSSEATALWAAVTIILVGAVLSRPTMTRAAARPAGS